MQKIYTLVAILAVAAGMAGCSEDEAVIEPPQVKPEVTDLVEVMAYTGESETRTALSEAEGNKFDVLWSAGDKIMIGDKEFTLSNGENTTHATFRGTAPADGTYTVYYPSTYHGTIWPDQQYASDNGISGAPMVANATVSEGEISTLRFTNVGGILRYTIKGDKTITSINVKGNGIDMTLDCGSGVALTAEGTVFNFALPAGTYTNAKLTFLADDYMIATKTAPEFVVKKNVVSKATFEASALKFQMSAFAPEGAVNTIWGREAVIVDLGGTFGKVAIATQNVGASAEKPYGETYTYNEATASDFLTDGWYVPSMEELYQLSLSCAWDATVPGLIGKNIAALNLPAAGGYTVQQELKPGEEGFYITTRTPDPDSFYGLLFLNVKDSFLATMEAGNRNIAKGSVRPFHKLEDPFALPEINDESPVGTRGMFYGQEAVVVDLGDGFGKYVIATKNVGADKPCDFGTKYPSSNLPTGADRWRMPKKAEFDALISNNSSSWTSYNGVPGRQFSIEGTQLFFPAGEGEQDMYWAKDNGRMTLTESSFATEALTPEAAQALSAPVRFVCKLALSADDPVGAIGKIDGREAIVADFGGSYGKYAIALRNEGASDEFATGTFYYETNLPGITSDHNRWHLPTKAEYQTFFDQYKSHIEFRGQGIGSGVTITIGSGQLHMPYSGYNQFVDSSTAPSYIESNYEDTKVVCWTSTRDWFIGMPHGFVPDKVDANYCFVLDYNDQDEDDPFTYLYGDYSAPARLFRKLQ